MTGRGLALQIARGLAANHGVAWDDVAEHERDKFIFDAVYALGKVSHALRATEFGHPGTPDYCRGWVEAFASTYRLLADVGEPGVAPVADTKEQAEEVRHG